VAKPNPHATDVIPVTLPTPTLNDAEALMDPAVALIETVPDVPLVANPLVLIAATGVDDDDQVTEFVRFCVLPSE
jgi:hypothetical protein